MNKLKNLALALTVVWAGVSCKGNKDYLVIFHTPYGDMKAVLYDETPLHKENFIELAREGKYDSTIFYRVINNFMIQGGDLTQKKVKDESGSETIPAEFVPKYFHVKGALAAARQVDQVNPEKKSSGSQFYIVQGMVYESEDALRVDQNKLNQAITELLQDSAYNELRVKITQVYVEARQTNDFDAYASEIQKLIPLVKEKITDDIYVEKTFSPERLRAYTTVGGAPHLDDEYTVFGIVVEGLEVIDKIATVKTARGDKPLEDIYITVELEEVPKRELTKKYGIEYSE